jgi:hypothetical protein
MKMLHFRGNRPVKGEKMNNRTLKTGRALVSLALVIAATFVAVPSGSAAGLPSVRLMSPSYDATNSVDATGDIAQYYSAGTKAFYTYIGHGTKLSLTYMVTTDGTTPAADQELLLQINAPWSGSKATWVTADGEAVAGQNDGNFGLQVSGTTDDKGQVTFELTNTDTTGLENAPTSPIQNRDAIKPARLYGTMKVVIPGKGDKDADIDLVTFDIHDGPATEFGPATQTTEEIETSLKRGKYLALPAKSSAGLKIRWSTSSTPTCYVIGKRVIAVRSGECVVTGSNAGNAKNKAYSSETVITID